MLSEDRRKRLTEALRKAGLDAVLLYGNAWQNDYLRYATDFGIIEGQALSVSRADGEVTLYLDSPLEAERAAFDCPGVAVVYAPDLLGMVDAALHQMRSQRIGGAPYRLLPRRITARANSLGLSDETALLDRLLMSKLDVETAAIKSAAHIADDGYAVFRQAARPAAQTTSWLPKRKRSSAPMALKTIFRSSGSVVPRCAA